MTGAGAHVIVIGGSSGMGLATAQAVLTAGGSVVVASSSDDRLTNAATNLSHGATFVRLDIADQEALRMRRR